MIYRRKPIAGASLAARRCAFTTSSRSTRRKRYSEMGRDMGLVQGGGVEDHLHASHTMTDATALDDRAEVSGE